MPTNGKGSVAGSPSLTVESSAAAESANAAKVVGIGISEAPASAPDQHAPSILDEYEEPLWTESGDFKGYARTPWRHFEELTTVPRLRLQDDTSITPTPSLTDMQQVANDAGPPDDEDVFAACPAPQHMLIEETLAGDMEATWGGPSAVFMGNVCTAHPFDKWN
ncbi:hypothetical protein PIIN_09646 [Serendipita indica DSM 11827]|uniref:Uncharacterized protein n=1 Tax=Serendipita indica (strain DSM 11827) TaxID=1109443 RepID=G4TWG3_SERID|nr:hypothetical protein PIIN_09646 [Serendipita indica DSM 11827]